jgi:hypothetical protein
MDRATDALKDLPAKYATKTVASDGEQTISGPTAQIDGFPRYPGINDAGSMVAYTTDLQGEPPTNSGAMDGEVPGSNLAMHAEKQEARLQQVNGTNDPIGVSQEQCGDCRQWFRDQAVATGSQQIIADPVYTRVYQPSGTVDVYDTATGQLVTTIPAGQPPAATPTMYKGIPW